VSKKTGRGQFSKNWAETSTPVICIYKLVTVQCKLLGFQRKLEKSIHDVHKRLFTLVHRRIFCWIDEWCDMSLTDVYEYQEKVRVELAQVNLNILKYYVPKVRL
jgi:hypothetical protein